MYFPEQIYTWLVNINVIPNLGEQDEKGNVTLPINIANNFDNGYLVGETIKKIVGVTTDKKLLNMLTSIKADNSKNTQITNWNFIWLAFDAIQIKMDSRIKELILRGQQALITQIIRKLYERYSNKNNNQKISIKMKSLASNKNILDFKKINLQKDPESSQSSLQFLVLLLRASLGMNIEQILGLFTNQNKFLAQIIVKGVNSNFDPIILFYSLLNKHHKKIKTFNQLDSQACLLALKTGFISKNEKVAQLAIDLFGKLQNIYEWFISQRGKCLITLLLGLKRHLNIKQKYWSLLLKIIKDQQLPFFTKHYPNCFQDIIEQIEVTTYLINLISKSQLSEQLNDVGVFSSWLQEVHQLPQSNIQAQIINFRFIGQLMLHLPMVIHQNEGSLQIFQRKWYMRSLPEFVMLFNELVAILEKLAQNKSNMSRKIYIIISQIAKNVSFGDKRDYLVQNFILLVAKFTTIPAQHLILNLKKSSLSSGQFLLMCQCIEINQNIETSISIGNLLKTMFIQQPLINFYIPTLLKAIVQKAIINKELGIPFLTKLIDEILRLFNQLQLKYQSKAKPNTVYFGRKGTEQKVNKQEQQDAKIKQKWKDICLNFISSLVNFLVGLKDKEDLILIVRHKIMDTNSQIRLNNHKIGSKGLQDILYKKFYVSKQQQLKHFQQFTKKFKTNLQESMLKKSKISQNFSLAAKLKGPQQLTKQLHQIAQKRKQQQQQKRKLEQKKNLLEQKRKVNVKKQLEITNLLRGQIGQAQLRQFGFLQRMIQQTKQLEIISLDTLQEREIDAIQSVLKKYHKVLRHLFITYTWTMHNNHSNQKFEDNQQRKQILNTVQLGKMLKDYRLAFLINQQEMNTLVRQINIKLFNKRDLNELDFNGFQQFIIQFCALFMIKDHIVTLTSSEKSKIITHNFKNQPIHFILGQFFLFLKDVFNSRGQKLTMFEDEVNISVSKQQSSQIQDYNKKIENRPDYILPKGYKKISQTNIEFLYKFSSKISIPQAYLIAVEILDDILSKQPFSTHIMQSIAEKKTVYKVKPIALGKPSQLFKLRAMSNYIERKKQLPAEKKFRQRKSTSKGISVDWQNVQSDKLDITQIVSQVVENIVNKLQTVQNKQKDKKKRFASSSKLQQLQKSKNQYLQKKAKQKEEKKLAQLLKQKQQEKRRREQTQKFLQQQKIKIAQKRKRQQQQKQLKLKEQQQKQLQKKQNKQKFKPFHQGQMQKIKKIQLTALQRIRKQKQQQKRQKAEEEQLKKKLRVEIVQQDKKIIELRKEGEQKIRILFESEPVAKVFVKYQSNLKALFDFLVQDTYISLTEKKHNNQIIFDTWRHFFNIFELSIIVLPKDVTNVFKILTKNKLFSKDYFVGLNFRQFQEALLRIVIKYKTVFNLISERIKDNIESQQINIQQNEEQNKQKQQKSKQQLQKEGNQFQNVSLTIKQIIKEHVQTKDSIEEYSDTSKVTNKTLLGLIYFLKIPNSKNAQQQRFRQILSNKHPSFVHQTQRLKEKLSQQYTLESPTKKAAIKTSVKKISTSVKQNV